MLYWDGDVWLVDFPQAVDPYRNPDAFAIFQRDLKRLCHYFARYGVASDPAELAEDLWARYGLPEQELIPTVAWEDDDEEGEAIS